MEGEPIRSLEPYLDKVMRTPLSIHCASFSRIGRLLPIGVACALGLLLWTQPNGFAGGGGGGAYTGDREWAGGGGSDDNWNVDSNWVNPSDGQNAAPPGDSIRSLSFGGEPALTTATNDFAGPYRVGELQFTNDGSAGNTASFLLDGNDLLVGDGDGLEGGISTTAIIDGEASITDTIALSIDLNALDTDPLDFDINANHHLRITGNVFDATGTNPESDITKTGTGSLIFEGNNTYQGTTLLSEGTLVLNGSQTNEGGLTVGSGATLSGDGSIGGLTTIQGLHAPGNSPGIQNFTDLTYDAGNLDWQLVANTTSGPGINFDRIQVANNLTFLNSSTVTLDFSTGVDWSADFWGYNIHEWQIWGVGGTTTGFPDQLSIAGGAGNVQDSMGITFADALGDELPSTAQLYLFQSGSSIYLRYEAALPEPTTFGILGLVLAALTGLARPRRRLDA